MLHHGYDIPTIAYFESNNIYNGNIGSFRATVWKNDLCYELRQNAQEAVFPLNTQGLFDSIDWIEQQRKEL